MTTTEAPGKVIMGGLTAGTATLESFPWGMEGAQEQARTWPDRIRKGEPGAFHTLFLRHSGELLGFVHCLLGDQQRAEHVVQEAFLDLYRSRRRVASDASPRSELYRLVTVRVLDEARDLGGASEAAGRPGGPRILGALARLPLPQRLALLLNRVPSLKAREVSRWLGTTVEEFQHLVLDASKTLAAELYEGCAVREAS